LVFGFWFLVLGFKILDMGFEKLEEIKVWQYSRRYFSMVYQLTKRTAFDEDYKFRAQIRAASGSIMDNIAEGFGRGGNKEFINFLSIANGSVEETRSQLYRAVDIGYITTDEFNKSIALADSIAKMITSLQSYLKNSNMKGKKFNKVE
jgi:four helix bundle protein